jgi:hydroxyacylglutathione hydrolase
MHTVIPIKAFKDNYIWCLLDSNKTCIVVDPGEAKPVLHFLQDNELELSAILVTHHHQDHTGGIKELLSIKQVSVFGSSKIPFITCAVKDNSVIEIANSTQRFMVIAVPGHTLDHVAYFQSGLVFTGDTLFTAGCGKIFEGTAYQMYDALFKLGQLPDETLIYCGHEYTEGNLRFALLVEPRNEHIKDRLHITEQLRKENKPTVPAPLSLEKLTNPFLRLNHEDVIAAASCYYKKNISDPIIVLKALREWKNYYA